MKKTKRLLYVFIVVGLLFSACAVYEITSKPEKLPDMTVAEKKARFKQLIIPAVDAVYEELDKQYQTAVTEAKRKPESNKLARLRERYKAADNQALLMALKPHPRSIAIAQAALESSWATSRFYLEANNVFGVWSFNKDEPRIAAGKLRGDKTIWVKEYDSIKDSVRDYYLTLARGDAYEGFRALKMQTDDPFELVKKLDKYSEAGAEYGKKLTSIISFNQFTEYDE